MFLRGIYKRVVLDRYGSRRGAIQTLWHKSLWLTGHYRKYSLVDWASVERLVFVCKGNICRSAYAEAIAKKYGVDSISCGINTKDDLPANKDAIASAYLRGIDLASHRTTRITSASLRRTDLLLAMEPWQADYLLANNEVLSSVTLLGLWGDTRRPHLTDPYGKAPEYFDNCFEYIEKSVYEVEKKIQGR